MKLLTNFGKEKGETSGDEKSDEVSVQGFVQQVCAINNSIITNCNRSRRFHATEETPGKRQSREVDSF